MLYDCTLGQMLFVVLWGTAGLLVAMALALCCLGTFPY